MPFSKGLACFLEMDLCYKVLSISCCFLACHDSKNLIKRENILIFFKKKPLYLDWKTYGSGRHCFGAMETHLFSTKYI